MPKTRDRKLSRLELAVLGLIWKGSPCTAYWIRQQFRRSPSSFFSGSAGAVYPAIRRLEERSLVALSERRDGRRSFRELRLTARGRTELESWLRPPFPAEDMAFTMDPVRTRVYYLEALPEPERRAFLDQALTQAKRRVAVVQAESEERRLAGDRFDYLGGLGVVFEAEARVQWLEKLCRELDHDPRSSAASRSIAADAAT